jgi:cysteine desulfurase/selenocysteine lyase
MHLLRKYKNFFIFAIFYVNISWTFHLRPINSRFKFLKISSLEKEMNHELDSILRYDFPILQTDTYKDKQLVYLDSGASSQKPNYVLDAISDYYKTSNANVHRGAHFLANKATEKYELARQKVQHFINAKSYEEIIFTKGATDGINLFAHSWSQRILFGDEIILSVMEHHSNLVPWQMIAQRTGAILKFVNLTQTMELSMSHFNSLLSKKTKVKKSIV